MNASEEFKGNSSDARNKPARKFVGGRMWASNLLRKDPGHLVLGMGSVWGAESPVPGLSKGKPLSEENTPLEETDGSKGGFCVTFILKLFFFLKKEKTSIDMLWPLASFWGLLAQLSLSAQARKPSAENWKVGQIYSAPYIWQKQI